MHKWWRRWISRCVCARVFVYINFFWRICGSVFWKATWSLTSLIYNMNEDQLRTKKKFSSFIITFTLSCKKKKYKKIYINLSIVYFFVCFYILINEYIPAYKAVDHHTMNDIEKRERETNKERKRDNIWAIRIRKKKRRKKKKKPYLLLVYTLNYYYYYRNWLSSNTFIFLTLQVKHAFMTLKRFWRGRSDLLSFSMTAVDMIIYYKVNK